MAKGVLYKANGSAWTKSQAKKANGSRWADSVVKHANGTTWYDNFPMEQYFTQTFNVKWSQGFRGDGVKLDDTAWFGNIITGSTTNYRGLLGFDKNAIQAFLGPGDFGNVTSARLLINCYETTTNGSPDVQIGKHSFGSEPASWNGATSADWGDLSTLHVPNKATGGYWVTLKNTQITLTDKKTAISGIALRGASATSEDMGKFNGVSSFTSKLEITVLK